FMSAAYMELGSTLRDAGDLAHAREATEHALAIRERLQGPNHPDVAAMLGAVATDLGQIGDLAGAEQRYRRALAIQAKAYGPDHVDVGKTLTNLGVVLHNAGRYHDA